MMNSDRLKPKTRSVWPSLLGHPAYSCAASRASQPWALVNTIAASESACGLDTVNRAISCQIDMDTKTAYVLALSPLLVNLTLWTRNGTPRSTAHHGFVSPRSVCIQENSLRSVSRLPSFAFAAM